MTQHFECCHVDTNVLQTAEVQLGDARVVGEAHEERHRGLDLAVRHHVVDLKTSQGGVAADHL